jgi:hypothetical protein
VVADEVLGLGDDPRQVAHAQLVAVAERERDAKACGIARRAGVRRGFASEFWIETFADALGPREVETQQLATVIGHAFILTSVAMFRWSWRSRGPVSSRDIPRGCERHISADLSVGGSAVTGWLL